MSPTAPIAAAAPGSAAHMLSLGCQRDGDGRWIAPRALQRAQKKDDAK